MSEMKTLTINNGKTYTVSDPDAPEDTLVSQGRSDSYYVTTPGWKRILNIIRASNGMLTLGVAKARHASGYSIQALGLDITGNVNFPNYADDTEPIIYQRYNHEFGENNSDDETRRARISQVRIGYPENGTQYPGTDGTVNYTTNPINCYVDVYVDFEPQFDEDRVKLDVNFAGYADSHNCEAILEETDATDTGIYGETLQYKTFTISKDATMYMPEGKIVAKEVVADNMPYRVFTGTAADPVILRGLTDGIYYISGQGKFYKSASTKTMMTGLYIVRVFSAYTMAVCITATTAHKVIYYKITDSAVEDTTVIMDDIAGNSAAIEKLKAEMLVIEDTAVGADAWSSKNIVDKLCPAFTESGAVVTCEPVEGYPLEVEWQSKNLFDDVAWFENHGFTQQEDGSWLGKTVHEICFTNTAKKPGSMYLASYAKADADSTTPMYLKVYYTDGTDTSYLALWNEITTFTTLTAQTDSTKTVDYIMWTYGGAGAYYIKDVMISFVDNQYTPYVGDGTVYHRGKNLAGSDVYDIDKYSTSDDQGYRYILGLPPGVYTASITLTEDGPAGKYFYLSSSIDGGATYSWKNVTVLAGRAMLLNGTASDCTFEVLENEIVSLWSYQDTLDYVATVQVERGETKTAYEPPWEERFAADGELTVTALPGVNTLWAAEGDITVTGRADPLTIISKQQTTNDSILERLSALEAAVVDNT